MIHLVVALVAGILGGAIWGFAAGYLKARTGAHEVITTIMLNYVALYGLNFLIGLHGVVDPTNPQQTDPIHESARLCRTCSVKTLPVDLGIILALAATARRLVGADPQQVRLPAARRRCERGRRAHRGHETPRG